MSTNLNNVSTCGQGLNLIVSQPHNSSGEFNLTPMPSESITQESTNVFVNYYMAHLVEALDFNSIHVTHYRNECNDYCHLCQLTLSQRRKCTVKGLGFLLDAVFNLDSANPNYNFLYSIYHQMFALLQSLINLNSPDLLPLFHHLNISLYHVTEPTQFQLFAIMRAIFQIKSFADSRISTGILPGGLLGGKRKKKTAETKKEQAEGETDKKYKKRSKEKKPLIKDRPIEKKEITYVGTDLTDGSCSIELVDSPPDLETTKEGPTIVKEVGNTKPKPKEGKPMASKRTKPQNSKATSTRASGRITAIAHSVMDQNSRNAGEKDALREQIKDLKEDNEEKKQECEVEVDLNTAITETGVRVSNYSMVPHDLVNIVLSARPACNVGVQLEPVVVGGVNITILVYLLFVFLLFSEFALVILAGYMMFSWLNIWLTMIYGCILIYLIYLATKYFIVLLQYLSTGKPVYSKLYTVASDTGEYFTYSTIDKFGNIMDLRPSEIKIGSTTTQQMISTAKLSGPIRAVGQNPNSLNFNEPVKLVPNVKLFGFIDALAVDGSLCFVDREGNLSGWRSKVYSLLHICFKNTPITYLTGSYTGKEFAKPANSRKFDSFVYVLDETVLQYDLHTYHNASTYSANSSQISEETNYSILYRKISRYTEINQSRFARKDLLTNAETLCRLCYFSIREAYPNHLSRQHF